MEEPAELQPGAMAGPWRIETELGRGGMGVVYGVVHELIGKRAALKLVHRTLDTSAMRRLVLEARVVNTIQHPNIIDIFEIGALDDGRAFLVMERLHGVSLVQRMQTPLPLALTRSIVLQICDALQSTHAAGVLHRDLKPENVFLVGDPNAPQVKILDWGIAKSSTYRLRETHEDEVVGTPCYLPPEQACGRMATDRSDVYSLGVLAYELFAHRLPFVAGSAPEVLCMHLRDAPARPRTFDGTIPEDIEELLLAMLAKDPNERPSIADVAKQLKSIGEVDDLPARSVERLLRAHVGIDDAAAYGFGGGLHALVESHETPSAAAIEQFCLLGLPGAVRVSVLSSKWSRPLRARRRV